MDSLLGSAPCEIARINWHHPLLLNRMPSGCVGPEGKVLWNVQKICKTQSNAHRRLSPVKVRTYFLCTAGHLCASRGKLHSGNSFLSCGINVRNVHNFST